MVPKLALNVICRGAIGNFVIINLSFVGFANMISGS